MPMPKVASTDPNRQAIDAAQDRNKSTKLGQRAVEQADAIAASRESGEPDYVTAAKERQQRTLLAQKALVDHRLQEAAEALVAEENGKSQAKKVASLT